jgi:hypothetical protein
LAWLYSSYSYSGLGLDLGSRGKGRSLPSSLLIATMLTQSPLERNITTSLSQAVPPSSPATSHTTVPVPATVPAASRIHLTTTSVLYRISSGTPYPRVRTQISIPYAGRRFGSRGLIRRRDGIVVWMWRWWIDVRDVNRRILT